MCGDCVVIRNASEMEGVLLRFLFHSKYDCADLELYAVRFARVGVQML